MIFDTHCHYNLSPLKEHWKDHWSAAQKAGVCGAVVVGTDYESSRTAVAIAESTPQFFAAVGTHPSNYHSLVTQWLEGSWSEETDFDGVVTQDIEQAKVLIQESVVAVGEVGLDYFRLPKDGKERSVSIALQQESLTAHLALAHQFSLPVILHIRDSGDSAYFDLLDILRNLDHPIPNCILHCVSGPSEYIKEAVDLGFWLGVAANVTYPSAHHIRSLLSLVPKNRILLETDAPYLPPQSHRGKPCEPWMISETARFLEDIGVRSEQCMENALEVFGLELPT